MNHIGALFKELFYRAELYWLGVRFCEREKMDAEFIEEFIFDVDASYRITFKCYRKTLIDLFFAKGQIQTYEYNSYFIEAWPDQDAPESIKQLKNRCIYFNGGTNRFKLREDKLLPLLAEIYLDFMSHYTDRWGVFSERVQ